MANIGSKIDEHYKTVYDLCFPRTDKTTLKIYNAYLSFGDLMAAVEDASKNCTTQADAGKYLYTWLQNRFNIVDKLYSK